MYVESFMMIERVVKETYIYISLDVQLTCGSDVALYPCGNKQCYIIVYILAIRECARTID